MLIVVVGVSMADKRLSFSIHCHDSSASEEIKRFANHHGKILKKFAVGMCPDNMNKKFATKQLWEELDKMETI